MYKDKLSVGHRATDYDSRLPQLIAKVSQWHQDRNLIEGATDKDIADDIGDIMVVLINIAVRNGLSMEHCLEVAYNDIKDRKGRMIDGVFVKETDDQ